MRTAKRTPQGKDDKVLVSWNGLLINTLAQADVALDEPRYYEAAERATRFLLENLRRDGSCSMSGNAVSTAMNGLLEDYAGLANALVSLYEVRFEEHWIDEAVHLADTILERFMDRTGGGFYITADDRDAVIVRQKRDV